MIVNNLRPLVIAKLMVPHIIGLTLWNVGVVIFHTLGHFPERWGLERGPLYYSSKMMMWSDVGIPFGAIAALGGALAIFLGFRNNSAYDRWWEARKIWGGLVNDSRSWTRQVVAWAEPGVNDDADEVKKELVDRHLAFVYGLAHHLRGQRAQLLEMLPRYVSEDEVTRYARVPNIPTALLIEQGKRVAAAREAGNIEHFRHLSMDRMLTRLSDIQGKCERIKNTPLPRQYDAFPRWFAYFYGFMLPFGLVEPIGWGAVPISVSITIIFLSLEISGRSIENPFEDQAMDTPMTALATTIERDLKVAIGEEPPPRATPNDRGILM